MEMELTEAGFEYGIPRGSQARKKVITNYA